MKKLIYDFFNVPDYLRAALNQLSYFYPIEAGKGSRVNLEFRQVGENEVSSCRKVDKKWVVSYSKLKFAGRGILYALSGKEGEIKSDFPRQKYSASGSIQYNFRYAFQLHLYHFSFGISDLTS